MPSKALIQRNNPASHALPGKVGGGFMRRVITGYKKYMTTEELLRILDHVKHDPYWILVFSMLAFMGFRSIELCRIRFSDILGDCEKIRFKLAKCRSHEVRIHERIIPFRLRPRIRDWKLMHELDHEYFFFPQPGSGSNDHLQPSSIRWKLVNIRRSLGLQDKYYDRFERISAHTFRHYCITRIYELTGNDLVATQEIIGHKRPSTTAVYIKPKEKELLVAQEI